MRSLFSRIVTLAFLTGAMACATLSPMPECLDNVDRQPQRQIVWRPVSGDLLQAMKSQMDPAWRNDPGAVVEVNPDKCIVYSPEPKTFGDLLEFWRLGDGIERCYRPRRPLALADVESEMSKEITVVPDAKEFRVKPEYRRYEVSLTPVLMPKKNVGDLAALLDPVMDEIKDYYRLYGFSLPDPSTQPVNCMVVAPRVESHKDRLATTILGHEFLHCVYGSWHPVDDRDQQEFGVLHYQPELKEVRRNLEELLKEKGE